MIYAHLQNACQSRPCPAGSVCKVDYENDSFSCIYAKKNEMICEGKTAQLSCFQGLVIDVERALYGRSSVSQPCPNNAAETICIKEDIVPETLRRIRYLCQGKNSCSFVANVDTLLGYDPCFGILKYVELRYVCKLET
ncbi:predicted protein [Nematostella vectensis]|uniref:SUEL-type lectin domain-containing protein n=1 Tax=Nematostella vectensis TaxID=45351 RepID=A7SMD5_NEMVE|nr:predicted protein [Nematostella vectensis]|eukprot:XP_001627191.1 predicted protein [Nematostella vectensis]